jgi:hypothetical protein
MANDRSSDVAGKAAPTAPGAPMRPRGQDAARGGRLQAAGIASLPGWLRLVVVIWVICFLLIGFQQLALQLFMLAGG